MKDDRNMNYDFYELLFKYSMKDDRNMNYDFYE